MESHPDRAINQNQAVQQIKKERVSEHVGERATLGRKETHSNFGFGVVQGSGQVAICLSE